MSDMNEYTPELFELVDDEGNKKTFELIDAAELNGEQYFCMVPSVEDENFLEEDCDIVILKTIEEAFRRPLRRCRRGRRCRGFLRGLSLSR